MVDSAYEKKMKTQSYPFNLSIEITMILYDLTLFKFEKSINESNVERDY